MNGSFAKCSQHDAVAHPTVGEAKDVAGVGERRQSELMRTSLSNL